MKVLFQLETGNLVKEFASIKLLNKLEEALRDRYNAFIYILDEGVSVFLSAPSPFYAYETISGNIVLKDVINGELILECDLKECISFIKLKYPANI